MLLALALFVISCDLSTLAAPAVPTPIPAAALNVIIAQTAAAAATQTAALLPPTETPSPTPTPTRTPTVTPSPTPTFLFLISTLARTPNTPTPGNATTDYACTLTDQVPVDGATLSSKKPFTASWTVQNTGSTSWDSNSVDFVYVSGTKLSSVHAADLPKSVAFGESITLKLSMTSPGPAGTYKTVWSLQNGKNAFCRLTLSIQVK